MCKLKTGGEQEHVMICNVWHVIARLSPAEEEESSEVRLWRKLCFGTTQHVCSQIEFPEVCFICNIWYVCVALSELIWYYLQVFLLTIFYLDFQNNICDWSRLYFQLGEIIISSESWVWSWWFAWYFWAPRWERAVWVVPSLQPGYVTPLHSAHHTDIPQPVLTIRHFNQ